MCDVAFFSSTKPELCIHTPWHGASTSSELGHPPADSSSLICVSFDREAEESTCSPSWVAIVQSIAAGICYGLVKPLFKIVACSQIGCAGTLKSSSVTFSSVQVVAMSVQVNSLCLALGVP